MCESDLLSMLRDLEVSLQQPEIRHDPQRLGALLHSEFLAFGRLGCRYDKADVRTA